MRTGTANLPLHGGKCPQWLFGKMKKLSGAISEAIVDEYGQNELLTRISSPYWFQSFGCLLGFDWHSSGLTTTVCHALKESVNKANLGITFAGGKGRYSRNTLSEIKNSSAKNIDSLAYASKITAKVDTSLLQDAYQLYHHSFAFTDKGQWAVIQQGMNESYARRYHWLSSGVKKFVEEPHNAICCNNYSETLDLSARQSRETRNVSLDLVKDNPARIFSHFGKQKTLSAFTGNKEENLTMTPRHWINNCDLTKNDKEILRKAYEFQPKNYEELLHFKGMGPKKIRALAMVSNIVYGTESSWRDPAKYSFSHGGKDGTPFPVDRQTYDNSIHELRESLKNAKLGERDKLSALKRLNNYIMAKG